MKTQNNRFHINDIPLELKQISQSLLNIEKKERSNPFTWRGQFSPQFVQVLLQTYAHNKTIVLDPFAGSGTVLYEAGRENLPAYGTEINPSAYIIARIYKFINIEHSVRISCINELDRALKKIGTGLPLLDGNNLQPDNDKIKSALINLHKEIESEICRYLFEALIVELDFYKDKQNLSKKWNSLKRTILELPFSSKPIEVLNSDARALPIDNSLIDLVITSPPYINVFNYHQQYRASVEALGWDVLSVAKSEIGSNRKNRGNRFLTVIDYCLDIAQVLCEIRRVSKKNARIIFVVGRESRIRNTPFCNSQIVALLGMRCAGLNITTRQERCFKNKFGINIFEDILHFSLGKKAISNPVSEARKIAYEILDESLNVAPAEYSNEIVAALDRISVIEPSRMYRSLMPLNLTSNIMERSTTI